MNTKIVDPKIIVANWVETVVVGLNLCPFAKQEVVKNRLRYSLSDAEDWDALISSLKSELLLLVSDKTIETTLLIHPKVLQDFFEYNQFLETANTLLLQLELEGLIQIASFHPDYQFAGTEPGDAENYTNKSPFPMLHLIREESLEKAILNYPDSDLIPEKNIEKVQDLGRKKMAALLQACFVKASLK
ncbi:MAG: DUF1415 domain-containing protein [Pseudomonadales bacterium]|nr:DUF1415 domain-containing protein [Pseudomonadales bacterium]